jgi:hypothetical protein
MRDHGRADARGDRFDDGEGVEEINSNTNKKAPKWGFFCLMAYV